jgi:hypothetical protein
LKASFVCLRFTSWARKSAARPTPLSVPCAIRMW